MEANLYLSTCDDIVDAEGFSTATVDISTESQGRLCGEVM